jgi:hypothetical protein
MSPRGNVVVVVLAALAVLGVVFATSRSPKSVPEAAAPLPSELPLVLFDSGYAVGPAYKVAGRIRELSRGTRTRCVEGEPNPEARDGWRKTASAFSAGNLSFAEIRALPDEKFAAEIGSRLLLRKYEVGFPAMTPDEQSVELAKGLSAEVTNGGLDQFFVNSTGNWPSHNRCRPSRAPRTPRVDGAAAYSGTEGSGSTSCWSARSPYRPLQLACKRRPPVRDSSVREPRPIEET